MVEPFKYLIQAVALERDDETGRIVRELPAQVLTVYSAAAAAEAIAEFETQLAAAIHEQKEPSMPKKDKVVTSIECDNVACPGDHELKKNDPAGWLFITAQVYGQPPTDHVFCSTGCVAAASDTLVPAPEAAPA